MTLTDAERCTATAKHSGERCGRRHSPGLNVCVMHGGGSKLSRAKSARFLAENKIRKSLDTVEIREVTNPLAEFRSLVSEMITWKDHVATHVAELDGKLTLLLEGAEIGEHTLVVTEQLKAVVPLYERALDRAGKFLDMWTRLGIDAMMADMQIRVTEIQVAALGRGHEAYRVAANVGEVEHQAGLTAMAKAMRGV